VKLRVGTRRSPLARTQTGQAMRALCRLRPDISWEEVEILTTGDRIQDRPLREAGGKGLFLRELDEALVAGRIDCAVHSLKDVPSDLAPGTTLAAVLERADPRDVLVTRGGSGLDELPGNARIGTTSLRRASQLLARHPQARIELLRGNVETRLRKLVAGDCDATFLAAAGLARLGLSLAPAAGVYLDPDAFVPAPGQGALAITARDGDVAVLEVLAALDHAHSHRAALAERAFARVFGGGCHLPLAVHAAVEADALRIVGLVASADGQRVLRDRLEGKASDADDLGTSLGRTLLARGAGALVAEADALSRRDGGGPA